MEINKQRNFFYFSLLFFYALVSFVIYSFCSLLDLGYLKKSGSESCIFIADTNTSLSAAAASQINAKSHVSNSLTMSSIVQNQRDTSNNRSQYFNRVNSSRQSSLRNASENGPWSNTHSAESSPAHT